MTRTIQQVDPNTQQVIAEFASPQAAAIAVQKPAGHANILLTCGTNLLSGNNTRKSYGFVWKFNDQA